MATAERIAIPIIRHDLQEGNELVGYNIEGNRMDANAPIDLTRGKEVESSQTFDLHLL